MNIGICTYWFNRGQGTVGRAMHQALVDRGHRVHVLARPTKSSFVRPKHIDRSGPWDVPNLTLGSSFHLTRSEMLAWATSSNLESVLFFQNYDFATVRSLTDAGIKTYGAFVWEKFGAEHAKSASHAYTALFSLHKSEAARYRKFNIDAELISFPAIKISDAPTEPTDSPYLLFTGGYMSRRKPFGSTLKAYSRSKVQTRLIVKTQVPLRQSHLVRPGSIRHLDVAYLGLSKFPVRRFRPNRNVDVSMEDLPPTRYARLFAGAQVVVAPERWTGLGLQVFESMGHLVPLLANDVAPLSDFLTHGLDAHLAESKPIGRLRNGLMAFEPDVDSLAEGFRALQSERYREHLIGGLEAARASRGLPRFGSELEELLSAGC